LINNICILNCLGHAREQEKQQSLAFEKKNQVS
jgi:hypothetical protein